MKFNSQQIKRQMMKLEKKSIIQKKLTKSKFDKFNYVHKK